MKAAVALVLTVASTCALPIENLQDWEAAKTSRQAPPAYGQQGYPVAGSHNTGAAASTYGGAGYGDVTGVFPHANAGGCSSVPLLLSCTPNIITGKIVYGYAAPAPAYKEVEDGDMREPDWMKIREANQETLSKVLPESEPKIIATVPLTHTHHHKEQTPQN